MHTYYGDLTTTNTRIPKERIVEAEDWHKTASLDWKEQRALRLIRETLTMGRERYGDDLKVVVSCSFGIDSMLTLHLVRRRLE